jgi:putative methylase
MNKKQLAIQLSKLEQLKEHNQKLEQYTTPSETAAEILWQAYMNNDIEGKIIADFGCGSGILGKGALLLGAKRVYFVDIDKKAIKTAKNNSKEGIFLNKDISLFNEEVDTIIQNPPFGTITKHIDKKFLTKAFKLSKTVYSIHKTSTKSFLEQLAKTYKFKVQISNFLFRIPNILEKHKKKAVFIETSLFIFKQ